MAACLASSFRNRAVSPQTFGFALIIIFLALVGPIRKLPRSADHPCLGSHVDRRRVMFIMLGVKGAQP